MNSPHFADLAKVHGEKEAYEMLASRPSHYDEAEYAKLMMDKPQGTKADEWAEASTMFAKGGDNLFAGVIAGVERDEEGNVTFDPAKFVLGLGGYTAVKAMLKNKQFQGVLKDYAQRAITELETGSSQGARFGRMFTGSNHIVDPSKGMQKEMRGIYNVTFNGKNATEVRKADSDAVIMYERGNAKYGAIHIEKHLQDGSVGQVSKEELLQMGRVIRDGKLYESYGKNIYELTEDGVMFRVVTGGGNNKEKVITLYSDRNIRKSGEGERYDIPSITNNPSKADIIPQNSTPSNPNMRGGHLEAGGAGKGLFDHDFSHLEQRVLEQSNKEFKDISQDGDGFSNMRSLFREYFTDSFSGAYHRARDLTHTNMQAKDSSISRLAKVLDGLDDATNRDLYRYLTKTGGENLTGDVRELADTLRANIDALGARAVDAGVLSEKAYKEWVGEYLIRQYESKSPKTFLAGMRGFTVDKIFERGIGKEFSNAKDMVGWLNKQGYIKDGELLNFGTMKQVGEYLQANGMLGKLGEGKIELTNMLNGKVKLRRDFTKAEREAMGELERNHILNSSIYYD